jgi:peroxisomal trans-2-enoyl-CoA reductase
VAGAAKEMGRLGEVASMRCNIRSEEDVCSLVAGTITRFGRLDFLVNNGGGQFPCPAADMSLKVGKGGGSGGR